MTASPTRPGVDRRVVHSGNGHLGLRATALRDLLGGKSDIVVGSLPHLRLQRDAIGTCFRRINNTALQVRRGRFHGIAVEPTTDSAPLSRSEAVLKRKPMPKLTVRGSGPFEIPTDGRLVRILRNISEILAARPTAWE